MTGRPSERQLAGRRRGTGAQPPRRQGHWGPTVAAGPVPSVAMKAVVSFVVRARIPPPLAPLGEIAHNLRWSWDDRTQELFRWIDPQAWEASGHDPVRLLGLVPADRLAALANDPPFLSFMAEVRSELRRYLESPGWFQGRSGSPLSSVAYFSPEFGIAEALPQY